MSVAYHCDFSHGAPVCGSVQSPSFPSLSLENAMLSSGRTTVRTRTLAAALLLGIAPPAFAGFDFSFTPNVAGGFGNFTWDVAALGAPAVANADITLLRGHTYSLHANTTATHPFYIKTAPSTGPANAYAPGSAELNGTNPLTGSGTLTFTPGASTPDTLYYDCGNHLEMQGVIHVVTDVVFANGFE